MTRPVIITRAEPGQSETAERVAAEGLHVLAAPMLRLARTEAGLPGLERVQGLVFTSANGVRFFCDVSTRRDLTAWCVGPATLASAQAAGFAHCEHADGDAAALAALIVERAVPGAGELVHIANAAAVGELVARLEAAGFAARFAPLYEAIAAGGLPEEVSGTLRSGEPCAVLVHSAKGAEAFAALAGGFDFAPHCLVAISKAASGPLAGLGFGRTVIAPRPNETALLDALFKTCSTL